MPKDKPGWMSLRDAAVSARFSPPPPPPIQPKTPGQARYLAALRRSQVTFCVGPPGTGKSQLAAAAAAEELRAGRAEAVVVSRPLVECGEKIGYLPGGVGEKIAPFVAAARGCLQKAFGQDELGRLEAQGRVQYHPLELMRGLTFERSIVLLDEAENATRGQLRMFLTRFAESSKVVVNGDLRQSDLEFDDHPPLTYVIDDLRGLEGVSVVVLRDEDVVRSRLVREIDKRLR